VISFFIRAVKESAPRFSRNISEKMQQIARQRAVASSTVWPVP